MLITIKEHVNTVSWAIASQKAPAEIVTKAKELSNNGEPVVIGYFVNTPTNWCVMTWELDNEDGQYRTQVILTAPGDRLNEA